MKKPKGGLCDSPSVMEPKRAQGNDLSDISFTDESKGSHCDTSISLETEEDNPAISCTNEPTRDSCGMSIGSFTIESSERRESDELGDSPGFSESKMTLSIKKPQCGFTVCGEPYLAQPSMTPKTQQQAQQNAFSTRKEKEEDNGYIHSPVALFEPAVTTKRPMYCKDMVYQGTTEFSFEEFRAISWKEKQRVGEETESIEREKTRLVEMENKLRELQEAMTRQMTELQRMAGGISTLVQGIPGVLLTSSDSSMEQGGGAPFKVYRDENRRSDSQVTNSRSTNSSLQQITLVDSFPSLTRQPSTATLISANPKGARTLFGSNPLCSHSDPD